MKRIFPENIVDFICIGNGFSLQLLQMLMCFGGPFLFLEIISFRQKNRPVND